MNFELVRTLAGMQALQPEWEALYRRLPGTSVFQSPRWVLNWIEGFASATNLRCLLLRDASGALCAVLPLVPVAMTWRRLPVTALVACTNAHSVRSGVLVDPLLRDALAAALVPALRGAGWDLLLVEGSPAAPSVHALPPFVGELPVERWDHCCVQPQGDFNAYTNSLSRDLRRNLRRAEKDLGAMGELRFELVEHDADALFEQWREIDRSSWKARQGETIDADPRVEAYYRRLVQGLAADGRLLGALLRLDGRPIAAMMCLRDKGTVYTLKTSGRADLWSARLSLGALLVQRVLQAVWAPEVEMVDFVNKAPYTERWTTQRLGFERRVLPGPSWRGRTAAVLDRAYRELAARRRAVPQKSSTTEES